MELIRPLHGLVRLMFVLIRPLVKAVLLAQLPGQGPLHGGRPRLRAVLLPPGMRGWDDDAGALWQEPCAHAMLLLLQRMRKHACSSVHVVVRRKMQGAAAAMHTPRLRVLARSGVPA